MKLLVIAEHNHKALAAATLNTITAAAALAQAQASHPSAPQALELHVLVAGHQAEQAARQAAQCQGVHQVWLADGPAHAEPLAEALAAQALHLIHTLDPALASDTSAGGKSDGLRAVVLPSSTMGKNLAPRLAAMLDVAAISDITKVISHDTFERPIYAGNVVATVQSIDPVLVVTARTTAFQAVASSATPATVTAVESVAPASLSRFVSQELSKSERPELGSAKVVVSGGRALGSAEQYQAVLTPLADKLGAALGASRAAVDAGYAPNDYQVGQTGKVVAPNLYIAIGMSGAIQHLAGMKDSKVIVAINKDPDAPIFQVADYGLVADLFEVVPQLTEKI
ncbi:MAG: electron transfer flavoprotein subunit alpha/FixB family protein [Burkholderiaceae bacterium]|jgi:electron transfer flavoprotein alpha subunit